MKINFSIETKYGEYSDALHLDDNHDLTDEDKISIKNVVNELQTIISVREETKDVEKTEEPLKNTLLEKLTKLVELENVI
jgi:hypothetical protein